MDLNNQEIKMHPPLNKYVQYIGSHLMKETQSLRIQFMFRVTVIIQTS